MADERHGDAFNRMKDDLEISLETPDLYSYLNLSNKATLQEIKSSFKNLSLIFHPDKHPLNSVEHKTAVHQFEKIKDAYNILSDATKRRVYDLYGLEGVKSQKWELVAKTSNPNEIKMIYENSKKLSEMITESELIKPTSYISLSIDFSDIFDRYLKETDEDCPLPKVNMYNILVQQSFLLGRTTTDTLRLTTQCDIRNGIGSDAFNIIYTKNFYPTFNNSWMDMTLGLNTDSIPRFDVKLSKTFTNGIEVSTKVNTAMERLGEFSLFYTANFMWPFTKTWIGNIQVQPFSKLKTTLMWHSLDNKHNLKTAVNLLRDDVNVRLSYNYIYTFPETKHSEYIDSTWDIDNTREPFNVKFSVQWGINSLLGVVGLSRRITKFTSCGMSLTVGFPIGVNAKLKFIRGNQVFILPLIMSDEVDPAAMIYGSIVPLAIYYTIKSLVYDRWKRNSIQEEMKNKRSLYKTELQRRRDEAYAAQSLMKEAGRRSYIKERKTGLIIECAVYGRLTKLVLDLDKDKDNDTQTGQEWPFNDYLGDVIEQDTVDVTVPLQIMVENSQLILPACNTGHNRSQLQGFYDPCVGLYTTVEDGSTSFQPVTKRLYVRYRFKNALHEVVVTDDVELRIPLKQHLVPS